MNILKFPILRTIFITKYMYKKITLVIIFFTVFTLIGTPKAHAAYKFPWAKGYNWQMTQGWHCAYDSNNNCINKSIDVGSSQNRYVIASDDSIVTNICVGTETVNVSVKHPGDSDFRFNYIHIDRDTLENNVVHNAPIKQGQVIGMTKAGTLTPNDGCGEMNQGSGFGHIHWAFSNSSGTLGIGRTIEGWTLCNEGSGCTGSTTTFTNGGSTVGVGGTIGSSNTVLITGNTVSVTRDYFAKEEIIIDPVNGGVNLTPSSGNVIQVRID